MQEIAQLEPKCLTDALRQSGALTSGCICDATVVRSILKQRSRTYRVKLQYEGSSSATPQYVILKMGHINSDGRPSYTNEREIAFYKNIAPALPETIVPRCYQSVSATHMQTWHLILEDLTNTHIISSDHPLPPKLHQCEQMVQAWACFHALHWNEPRIQASSDEWPYASWNSSLHKYEMHFRSLVDHFGEILSPKRQAFIEQIFDKAPLLYRNIRRPEGLTLVHGDAHWWNCFLPADGSNDVRLFDWEDWHTDHGTMDMAYMMAMLWFPDMRRRVETPLLHLYHSTLLAAGVTCYDQVACRNDYLLSVLLSVFKPIGQAASGVPARVWWPNLERIMLSIEDLECYELM